MTTQPDEEITDGNCIGSISYESMVDLVVEELGNELENENGNEHMKNAKWLGPFDHLKAPVEEPNHVSMKWINTINAKKKKISLLKQTNYKPSMPKSRTMARKYWKSCKMNHKGILLVEGGGLQIMKQYYYRQLNTITSNQARIAWYKQLTSQNMSPDPLICGWESWTLVCSIV